MSVVFGVVFALLNGWDLAAQFFAGYVVEKSLSVDNLFVFAIIIGAFAVPPAQQPKVLTIGIVTALMLRAVFIALGAALLELFAFDSIPAVFGVTDRAYIVLAANAFALLGLRPLFFLVSGLLERLVYMSAGLALILAFIGAKLVLEFAHHENHSVPEISTAASLAVILTVLTLTMLASLHRARSDPGVRAHPGSLTRRARHGDNEKPPGRMSS